MPTVPRLSGPQVATAPLPGVRSPRGAPVEAFGGGAAAQPIDTSGMQRVAADIFAKERAKANELAVLKASSQLSEAATALQIKVASRKGEDAFAAPDEVTDDWKKVVESVRGTVRNDEQRAAIEGRIASEWDALNGRVQQHVAREREAFDHATTESFITNKLNYAIANYGDDALVKQSIAEAGAAVRDWGKRNGVGAEAVTQKVADVTSKMHLGVIARMNVNGLDLAAKTYLEAHRGEIVGTDLAGVEQQVKRASSDGEGMRAADAVWKEFGPKGLNDPVRIAGMEQAIRDRFADLPEIIKAGVAELRSRAQAHSAEQTEVLASNVAATLGAFNDGASLSQIKRMSEYLALPGDKQESIVRHIIGRAREDRSEQRERQEAAFWGYADPDVLNGMSEKQVRALQPELGLRLTQQLLKMKTDVKAVSVDSDLFNTVAQQAGLDPYKKKASTKDRARLGGLRNAVEEAIEAEQRARGRQLSRDEKLQVMQGTVDRKVMLDVFGQDEERIGATLTTDERGQAYIPIEEIPSANQNEMRRFIKSVGGTYSQRKLERMRAARMLNDPDLYEAIAREK